MEIGLEPKFFFELEPPKYPRDSDDYCAFIYSISQVHDADPSIPVITAVGSPSLKLSLLAAWPGKFLVTVVSPKAWLASDATLGPGTTLAPFVAVNRKARVGSHVLVNVGAIISHDVSIGNFTTIGPRCVIGGATTIGEGAFLGIGSTIRDHIHVGAGSTVAAGAVVVSDVAPHESVKGIPARAFTPRTPRIL
jgi:sugar O-acyltransferase (sialic acid O-acetyltransferase NeuD family)